MKEFIFGGLIAVWLFLIGLSPESATYSLLAILFPIIIIGIMYNSYLVRKIVNKKRSHSKKQPMKYNYN